MKNIFLGILFFTCSLGFSQTQMSASEVSTFKKEIANQADKTTSITAEFEETKYVSVLKTHRNHQEFYVLKAKNCFGNTMHQKRTRCCLTKTI